MNSKIQIHKSRLILTATLKNEAELPYQPCELDDDEALKLGIAASKLEAIAEWQGLAIQRKKIARYNKIAWV
jgi:hypothetical protein